MCSENKLLSQNWRRDRHWRVRRVPERAGVELYWRPGHHRLLRCLGHRPLPLYREDWVVQVTNHLLYEYGMVP